MNPFSWNQFQQPQDHLNLNLYSLLHKTKQDIEVELIQEIQLNAHLRQLLLNQKLLSNTTPVTFPQSSSQESKNKQNEMEEKSPQEQKPQKLITQEKKVPESGIIKNSTKNIPKNFGKAIITFVELHPNLIGNALKEDRVPYIDFVTALKEKKRGINSISDLRSLWLDE